MKKFLAIFISSVLVLLSVSAVSAITITESVSPGTPIPQTGTSGLMVPDSTITFSETGIINTMEVYLNISHTYQGDLWIDIFNSDYSSSTPLWERTGSYLDNVIGYFDVTAWASGMDISGDWHLRVFDDALGDTGTLNSWSITADYAASGGENPVPEPATMLLFGLGLLGLAGVNRRKK